MQVVDTAEPPDADDLARELARIAREAGRVLASLQSNRPAAMLKPDASPVTAADLASEALILAALTQAFPGVPIISEENAKSHCQVAQGRFLLVDPLDGTRAFVAGTDDFAVLIAMVEDGVPIAGAIHAPISDESWWAGRRCLSARGPIEAGQPCRANVKRHGGAGPVAIVSAFHGDAETEALLAAWKVSRVERMSSALKFVHLAQGHADLYPRRTRTMQWDIAAGDALLRAVGGGILDDQGRHLVYGREEDGWASPPFLAHARLPQD